MSNSGEQLLKNAHDLLTINIQTVELLRDMATTKVANASYSDAAEFLTRAVDEIDRCKHKLKEIATLTKELKP